MAKIQKKSKQQFHLIPFFYFPPKDCPSEGAPNYLPTEFTEPTEVSGARYSPTDCTDIHRLGGYGILPYPRSHQTIFPQKPTQPNHLCASVKSVGGSSPPEASMYSVNSVGGSSPPEASVYICEIRGRFFSARSFCVFCEICGRLLSARRFCGFCVFRGRFLSEAISVQRRPLHPLVLLQAFHLFYWQA